MNLLTRLASPMRVLGPYVALGLIVPGRTVITLSLWALITPG
jgi:hypothetical protein